MAAGYIGWLPENFMTLHSMYFGSAAETILLSLALAARIKLLKEQKLESELKAIEIAQQLSDSDKKLEKQMAVSALASQVAHDIRSPLAALDSVLKDIGQLPEDKRIIVRGAASRIRDIANDLVRRNQQTIEMRVGPNAADSHFLLAQLVSALIEPLITEKRMQFRSKIDLEIEGRFDASAYGLFIRVQPVELKRVLSNLINNAVEAVGDKGSVVVALDSKGDEVIIKVQDNGQGIPPEILAKLGQKGETHGKTGGSGLGLYHAKTAVQSWQGSLAIESKAGEGTTITVKLPKAQAPDWFVSRLILESGKPIVILDDDASIHQVWQGRLDSLRVKEHGIEALHFSVPDEFRGWVLGNATQAALALYLSDYELLGQKETGLDLAEELGLGEQTILVTSRYEEPGILKRCGQLKVRLIPKNLAAYVPISVENAADAVPRRYDAVLIDDDVLVRKTWEIAAKQADKTLAAFAGVEGFLKEAANFGPETTIYIDNDLGDGIKGVKESLRFYDMGFRIIYLATGSEPESFPFMPWIKQVVGKESPWG